MSASTISGGEAWSCSIAWSPSLTAITCTSSSAKVSSMTRWIVTLSSARRRVYGTLVLSAARLVQCRGRLVGPGRSNLRPLDSDSGPRVAVDELDDLRHRRPRQEDPFDPDFVES